MITLKIDTQNGTLSEEAAIFNALITVLDEMKEEGKIKDYFDVQVKVKVDYR